MKIPFVAVALILLSTSAFAQTSSVKVEVDAGNKNQASQDVADSLAGLIGASSRYALVTNGNAEILVFADCIPDIFNGQQTGVTCHTTLSYWPVNGVGISTDLVGMISGGSESQVAKDLFNAFVRETSDEKLVAAATSFKHYLNAAIANFPQGVK